MARIPEEEIERLKREISLERLAEAKGVTLRRHGENLIGLCPFHDDREPSLVITPSKNLWHCLGACQAGGTVIDWTMKAEGVSYRHALELLREGFPSLEAFPSSPRGRQQGKVAKKTTTPKLPGFLERSAEDEVLLRQVVDYYHEALKASPEALGYLQKRGLHNSEMLERFHLGYANRTLCYRLPQKNRVSGAELRGRLQELGVYSDKGHELFNGSLVIPVFDTERRVTEIYGRKVNDHLRTGTPKHLYLPGPHQGVWNIEAFQASKEIILCEALIDALTFWCAGFRNVTASYGINGFTPAHREALTRYGTERVYIAYDRDEAGEEAAGRLGAELAGLGIEVYRVLFPKGMDANEYALKVTPAEKSLGMALRQATWVGGVRRRSESRELGDEAEELSRTAASVETSGGAARGSEPCDGAVSAGAAAADFEESGAVAALGGAAESAWGADARSGLGGSDGDGGAAGADADGGDAGIFEAAGPGAATRGNGGDERTSGGGVPASAESGVNTGAIKPATFAADKREVGAAHAEPEAIEPRAALSESSPTSLLAATVALKDVAAGAQASAPRSRQEGAVVSAPTTDAEPLHSQSQPARSSPQALTVSADEVTLRFGDRRWRVRGLPQKPAAGALRVNVLVAREGGALHVDTLELYSARQRAHFTTLASGELGLEERVIKRDLGEVLLKLEEFLEKRQKESEQAAERRELTEAEKTEALGLLCDPRLLERILEDFERAGVVGESTNKLVGYLAATSRKLEQPLAVVIQSSSAAGKSSLMDAVLGLMPEEERVQYSAMTGQSLFYMGEANLSHKILAIVEEQGAERASYALKLLQSEGELTIASTGKDPATGRLVTQEYHVEGPVMIFQTTTAVDMDEELLNRCIVLTVDEGREQTKAIHERQRRARTLEGMIARQERERILALHQNAQRLIRPLFVVNPYASELKFPDHQTRMRRDHTKYLGLIEAVTLLHQYQRPVREIEHRGQTLRYIEVTREDIAVANRLAHEVLGRSLDELPPQTRRLLGMLEAMVSEESGKLGIDRCDYRFSRREVRERTGWSYEQLRVHLGRLVEFEYLLVHRGARGQSFVYELCYDGGGTDGGAFLMGLTDAVALATSTTATLGGAGESLGGLKGEFGGPLGAHTGAKPGGLLGAEKAMIQHQNSGRSDWRERDALKTHSGNGQSAHVVTLPGVVSAGRRVS